MIRGYRAVLQLCCVPMWAILLEYRNSIVQYACLGDACSAALCRRHNHCKPRAREKSRQVCFVVVVHVHHPHGKRGDALSRPRRQTLRLAVEGMWSIAPVVVCFSLRSSPAPSSEDRPCRFKAFAIEGQPDFANGRAVGAGGRNRRAARAREIPHLCTSVTVGDGRCARSRATRGTGVRGGTYGQREREGVPQPIFAD